MAKILVAGGAGYIGSHCVRLLGNKGYTVVVVDNLQHGHRESIGDITFIQEDLANKERIGEIFCHQGPFEAVLHFAAFIEAGISVREPLTFYQNNVANSIFLLQNMVEFGCKCMIFSSSAAVYGEPQEIPIPEHHPLAPVNPYGWSKFMIEQILHDCGQAYGIRFACLRYFNAAGAHPHGDIGEDHHPESHLIPRILKTALSIQQGQTPAPLEIFGQDYPTPDGTCIRDYIHICDLAQAHILCLEYLLQGGTSEVFNLGNGCGYSVKEVLTTASKVTKMEIPYQVTGRRAGDPAILVASSAKIQKTTGWQPQYPQLVDIIDHAWQWHQRHPQGFTKTHRTSTE